MVTNSIIHEFFFHLHAQCDSLVQTKKEDSSHGIQSLIKKTIGKGLNQGPEAGQFQSRTRVSARIQAIRFGQ